MPRNSSTGAYVAPTNSVNPAVANTVISPADFNDMLTDVETALSTTVATTRALWPQTGQVQDDAFAWCGTAGGTADALTLTPAPAITAYTTGARFAFITGSGANTTAPTVNVSGLGVKSLKLRDGSTMAGGDLPPSSLTEIRYDGTDFRLDAVIIPPLSGGATSTTTATSFSLTSTSTRVQAVVFTADYQFLTLPDATTLSPGGPSFIIQNLGTRTFGIRNSAGTMLAAVEPGGTAEMYLGANATAAGTWTTSGSGLQPGIVVINHTFSATITGSLAVAVRLTDTFSLHFCQNGSSHPFVVAVDHSPGGLGVGTPVLIVASGAAVEHAFRISDTKASFKIAGASSNVYNVTVSGVTCTVSSAASAAVFDAATFTGEPLIAVLGANSDVLVAMDISGGAVRAQAVDCSGTNPSAGSSVNIVASGGQALIGIYRVSDTTALALYVDDSGTPGSPYSIRGVVLSLSGTTITVNSSSGINDVLGSGGFTGTVGPPSCQLTDTSYIVGYYQASGTLVRSVAVTVTGTSVAFGTPLTIQTTTPPVDLIYTAFNSNRFQPLMFRVSDTTALFTYCSSLLSSMHGIITNTGGTLTYTLYARRVWDENTGGGNFPQTTSGFLAFGGGDTATVRNGVVGLRISGGVISVAGVNRWPGISLSSQASRRFGLSGGICGIGFGVRTTATAQLALQGAFRVYKRDGGNGPVHLGDVTLDIDVPSTDNIPVEVAPLKVAVTGGDNISPDTGSRVKLVIMEFAA